MTKMRDHRVFTIHLDYEEKSRIENDIGELTSYGDICRKPFVMTVVAPSEPVAQAWVLNHFRESDPRIKTVDSAEIHGFIQDHIW